MQYVILSYIQPSLNTKHKWAFRIYTFVQIVRINIVERHIFHFSVSICENSYRKMFFIFSFDFSSALTAVMFVCDFLICSFVFLPILILIDTNTSLELDSRIENRRVFHDRQLVRNV